MKSGCMVDLSWLYLGLCFAFGAHSKLYHGIYKDQAVAVKIIIQPEDDENGQLTARLEKQFTRELSHPSHLSLSKECNKAASLLLIDLFYLSQSGDDIHVHWKGAVEIILAARSSWLDADGSKKTLTPDKVNHFKKTIEDMAAASLRCVAFAYRLYDLERVPCEEERERERERESWQLPEDDLILLAIVGIKVHSVKY
ncbi:calcium-transporting ATPase 8, plasma membrane-type [Canna indica]|uniref:Calcium-transporting ATPase 8, plasma membrane-type n=1 Tax=Canna indica TaxID=4628 RepID=A0AAQ3KAE5_9LILI|nr:calcium-transporting ATPase 8, plasma membrane-type [Canna indica]